jgi:N-acetylmuramoyl-L-alanine amidase
LKPDKITIHCSDSPDGRDVPASEIERWHIARGFRAIGYHAVIQPSGKIEYGRKLNEIGAHVKGHNTNNLGICLVGRRKFTHKQFEALRMFLDNIFTSEPQIPQWAMFCHHEFDPGKTCPNMEIKRILRWYWTGDTSAIDIYLLAS